MQKVLQNVKEEIGDIQQATDIVSGAAKYFATDDVLGSGSSTCSRVLGCFAAIASTTDS